MVLLKSIFISDNFFEFIKIDLLQSEDRFLLFSVRDLAYLAQPTLYSASEAEDKSEMTNSSSKVYV